jgi:Mg-chelatase subunit ChlD
MKSTYKGHEFRAAIENLANKVNEVLFPSKPLAGIAWTDSVTTAAINKRGQIYLADVLDEAVISRTVLEQYSGFVIHELLHRKYTNFNFSTDVQYINALHNAIEDVWIERKGIADKLTGNIEGLLTSLVNGMVDKAMAEVSDWANPAQYPFVLAIYGRTYAKKVPLAAGLEPIFSQACARIDACKTSGDTLMIARWVFAQLQGLDNTPQKPQNTPSKGEQGEGEGEGAGDAGEGSKGDAGDAGKTEEGQAVGGAVAPNEYTEAVEVEPTNQAPDNAGGAGSYSEHDHLADGEYHLNTRPDPRFALKASVPAKLRYEVKRLFENSGSDEFQLKRKAGMLNVNALSTIASGATDLFKRRQETEGIDSAVVVLLDVSGSMFDDTGNANAQRMTAAVQTTAALLDTLNKAGVSTALLTFGSDTAVLKSFDMPAKKAIPLLERVKQGGSTNDHFAIRYAHKLLLKRPEQRKVVFSITDGAGNKRRARVQIRSGERLGITTVGIGVQYNVADVYNNHVNIQSLEDLGTASFKQIKLAA